MWLAVLACLPLAAQIEGPAPDPLEQGYRSLREGDAGGAVDWFRQAAEGQPAASVAWRELGYAYLRIGEDGSAQQVFEQVLADEPTDARPALDLAYSYQRTGDRPRAEAWFTAAAQSKDAALRSTARGRSRNCGGLPGIHPGKTMALADSRFPRRMALC